MLSAYEPSSEYRAGCLIPITQLMTIDPNSFYCGTSFQGKSYFLEKWPDFGNVKLKF
jgi:hypothetical protein